MSCIACGTCKRGACCYIVLPTAAAFVLLVRVRSVGPRMFYVRVWILAFVSLPQAALPI